MTTMLGARELITTKFAEEYTTTEVAWPNKLFHEPKDGAAWVQFNIDFNDSIIATISQKNNEQLGNITTNIFTARNSGTIESTRLAQEIRGIFNRIRITDILFEAPDIREVPTPVDNNWFQRLVRVNFSYYEFVT